MQPSESGSWITASVSTSPQKELVVTTVVLYLLWCLLYLWCPAEVVDILSTFTLPLDLSPSCLPHIPVPTLIQEIRDLKTKGSGPWKQTNFYNNSESLVFASVSWAPSSASAGKRLTKIYWAGFQHHLATIPLSTAELLYHIFVQFLDNNQLIFEQNHSCIPFSIYFQNTLSHWILRTSLRIK